MKPLTTRQKEVLQAIARFIMRNSYPPTIRELADLLKISTPRGVVKHLHALDMKGYIKRTPGVSRGIELIKDTSSPSLPHSDLIPVLGSVPAGIPETALENLEDYLSLDPTIAPEGSYLLRVTGDSMSGDHILPGDMAVIRSGLDINNGDIVVAVIDGEATLKRISKEKDRIHLIPSNPSYQTLTIDEETADARIAGRVEAIIRLLRNKGPTV